MSNVGMLSRWSSTQSLFRGDTQTSLHGGDKTEDLRDASDTGEGMGRLRAISRVTWGSVARGMRPLRNPPTIKGEFQQHLHLNVDIVVAAMELTIALLSCVQLELSSMSPRWRENRACERHESCQEMLDEGSFLAPNCIRLVIGVLGLVRLFVRARCFAKFHIRIAVLETIGVLLFPYPGMESFLKRDQADLMVFLSIVVGLRTICWRQLLYFPYPIRQKRKVASFSGNLEFSYREFVFKKVMDEQPLRKMSLMCAILLVLTSFLVGAIDTVNGTCVASNGVPVATASQFQCAVLGWRDAAWLVATSFVTIGFGDVVPKSNTARLVIVFSACIVRGLTAMLASVIIKKFQLSSMEARVHSFLTRMDLFNSKDLSAVMAVQASFRFNKSYKRSLMWHKHNSSHLYYRPLSARLPNEVKKKLNVSRFQANLKEIIKFNTDGDPLNSFTKHIEVITAALGITFVEMAQLKRIYYRKSRILEELKRQAQAKHDQLAATTNALLMLSFAHGSGTGAAMAAATESTADDVSRESVASESVSPRGSNRNVLSFGDNSQHHQLAVTPSSAAPSSAGTGGGGGTTSSGAAASTVARAAVAPEWGFSMLHKCEHVLAQLQQIERTARAFDNRDRRSSFQKLR